MSFFIQKRDGSREEFSSDFFRKRIQGLVNINPPLSHVDIYLVSKKFAQTMCTDMSTKEFYDLAAETCAYMSTIHPDYSELAARFTMFYINKITSPCYFDVARELYYANMLDESVWAILLEFHSEIQKEFVYERDYLFDYFGIKTLEKSYLITIKGKIVERPQHLWMRVALGIHKSDLPNVFRTYHELSQKYYIHATPTLFNAGTRNAQMASCFLLQMTEDSLDGIYDTLGKCAQISKYAGGIGLAIHKIRASGSYIAGTNGKSNGLVPMLRVFNETSRYVDQGGGKRKGTNAVYLEPWHADIEDWLQLKKNSGKEELRCRDLFYGLWVPDLFMKRVEADLKWSLFCPKDGNSSNPLFLKVI